MNNLIKPATIIDRFCGSGKTTGMINGLDANEKYLIIVPYLSEVKRIINESAKRGITFYAPKISEDKEKPSKLKDLLRHAASGHNIVTTHAMFPQLNRAAMQGVFKEYNVYIDEVVETIKQLAKTPSKGTWENIVVNAGFATVDEDTGQVFPTEHWDACFEDISDSISVEAYLAAKAGTLYAPNSSTIIWALPKQLLTAGKTLTVYTFKSDGSLMCAYMQRVGLEYVVNPDFDVSDLDKVYLDKARRLITCKLLKNISGFKYSLSGQMALSENDRSKVSKKLNSMKQRELKGVPLENIIVTCVKRMWFKNDKSHSDLKGTGKRAKAGPFAERTGLFKGVNWLPNTTRGTNDYDHCSHVIYLYDQYTSPAVGYWLNMRGEWAKRYALSEAIQLIWRSRIRDQEDKPITVYFGSKRMYGLFTEWLREGSENEDVLED